MQIAPTAAKLILMGGLTMIWLMMLNQARRLDSRDNIYFAMDLRDKRLARFYSGSVWLGLGTAFLSLVCLDAFDSVAFDSHIQHDLIASLARAAGVWGLLVIGAVWSQMGFKAGQVKYDPRTLRPSDKERDSRRDSRDGDSSDRK